jgi:hypothetical protein
MLLFLLFFSSKRNVRTENFNSCLTKKIYIKKYINFFLSIQVILETSRLATVVNGVLRKTTQDVDLNGIYVQQTHKFIK